MKKFGAKIAILTALMMLLTGCSEEATKTDASKVEVETNVEAETKDEAEAKEENVSTEEITLKTVSMFGATDPALEFYNQKLEEFQETYANVTITDESSISDETWKAKIKADFAVGNEPDVILYFTDANCNDLVASGSFVDIETIRKDYPDFVEHIYPHTFKTMPDDKQYAVSTRGFYEALFVNKDLFEQYDLELPTDWEKLMTAVETFSDNGIIPFAASFADVPHYMIEHLVLAAGGIEDHKVVPASAEEIPESWVTAMEQFKVLFDAGAFPVDVNATTNPLVNELFFTKKAAMVVDGSWFNDQVEEKVENSDTVVAMPFPSMTEANSTSLVSGFTSGWYISSKAWEDESKREALVNFVEAVSSPEFLAQITTVAPCEIEASAEMSLFEQSAYETFVNSGTNIDLPIDSRISGESWNAWVTSVGSIAEGEADPLEELINVIDIFTGK